MSALSLEWPASVPHRPKLDIRRQAVLAVVCLCAGVAPLAARWIPADAARILYGVSVAAVLLALTLFARRAPSLQHFWKLSFAFFVLALVQVLNNSIPGYFGSYVLHDPPNWGNPLASTVSGSVVIQLLETLLAIVPVVVLTRTVGSDLGAIYARPGVIGKWLALAIAVFVILFLFTATIPLRPDSPAQRLLPSNGPMSFDRFVMVTPALLVMVVLNPLQEEVLFRGLFLQQYEFFFGARLANVLQALIFAIAHAGVSYTPVALVFIVLVILPVGLFAGYLMRATNGVLAPAIFHAAFDIPLYVAFLSYVP